MGLRELISGGLSQVRATVAREMLASIDGRPVPVCLSSINKDEQIDVDGVMYRIAATFVVEKDHLKGHSIDTLRGKFVTFDGVQYRIAPSDDNGLSFTLRCTAKDQAK